MNIPNIMTICRFILIPFFFWAYKADNFLLAAILFFVAGVTDVLDGMIARKFNMTTELGKIIDPLADKLMQMCAVVLLAWEFPPLLWLLAVLCAKEVLQIIGGFKLIKDKKEIMPSKWYGKLNTAIIFVFLSLLIWRGYGIEGHLDANGASIGWGIPKPVCFVVFGIVGVLLVYSFIRYYNEGFKGAYTRAAVQAERHAEKAEKLAERAEKHAEKAKERADVAVKNAEQAVEKANSKAERAAAKAGAVKAATQKDEPAAKQEETTEQE